MYGLGELRDLPQKRGDSETMPYVARELSWELASYLETESFHEGVPGIPNSVGALPGWTGEEERLAG
jgi:hypothetical protein